MSTTPPPPPEGPYGSGPQDPTPASTATSRRPVRRPVRRGPAAARPVPGRSRVRRLRAARDQPEGDLVAGPGHPRAGLLRLPGRHPGADPRQQRQEGDRGERRRPDRCRHGTGRLRPRHHRHRPRRPRPPPVRDRRHHHADRQHLSLTRAARTRPRPVIRSGPRRTPQVTRVRERARPRPGGCARPRTPDRHDAEDEHRAEDLAGGERPVGPAPPGDQRTGTTRGRRTAATRRTAGCSTRRRRRRRR